MTETEKFELMFTYVSEFRRIGRKYYQLDEQECDALYFEKRELFFQQLNQPIENVATAKRYFYELTKSIHHAHYQQRTKGWSWQIKVEPLPPPQQEGGDANETTETIPPEKK